MLECVQVSLQRVAFASPRQRLVLIEQPIAGSMVSRWGEAKVVQDERSSEPSKGNASQSGQHY
jgi:hypothetical protein